MLDTTPQSVLAFYDLDSSRGCRIEALENAGGWSGAKLWRITDLAGRQLCLRRWPKENPTPNRLRQIHGVLAVVAPELPVAAYPLPTMQGQTFVEHDDRLWELTEWRPGKADYQSNPGRARLRSAMQTLARFHELAARYQLARSMPPPAFLDRRREMSYHRFGGADAIEGSLAGCFRQPAGRSLRHR